MNTRVHRNWFLASLATVLSALAVVVGVWAQDPEGAGPLKIRPGDRLYIAASDLLPDNPVKGQYLVESTGKIVLGPEYGRVEVSGLTVEEAEVRVRDHLAKYVREPHVSLTWYDARSHIEPAVEERLARLEKQVAELRLAMEQLRKR